MTVDWKSDWVALTNCLTEIDMEWLADYIFLSKMTTDWLPDETTL